MFSHTNNLFKGIQCSENYRNYSEIEAASLEVEKTMDEFSGILQNRRIIRLDLIQCKILFIYSMGVLCQSQEYFIRMMTASIVVEGKTRPGKPFNISMHQPTLHVNCTIISISYTKYQKILSRSDVLETTSRLNRL